MGEAPRAERVLNFMALLLSLAAGACLVLAYGWYHAATRGAGDIDALPRAARYALAKDILNASPGVFAPAVYNPDMGYTLKPGQMLTAWDDTFMSNDLGYRGPASTKPEGTMRVLFVGDSWTYGLGVRFQDAFPFRFQRLARAYSGSPRRVQAWSLALPGYNTWNELAALETLSGMLRPDAVVLCPTSNDADSTRTILPNGSLGVAGFRGGPPGDVFPLTYHDDFVGSHVSMERWRRAFGAMADSAGRLRQRGVPTFVFFTALWHPELAHGLVKGSHLRAPYLMTPLTELRPRMITTRRHPNPEAHARYAQLVYQLVATSLAWNPLPQSLSAATSPVFTQPPEDPDDETKVLFKLAASYPTSFQPGPGALRQSICLVDHVTGLMARDGYVLLRRADGSSHLRLRLRRLDERDIYPLKLAIEIPSTRGTRTEVRVAADGDDPIEALVALPPDIPDGAVVDVLLHADRVSYDPARPLGGALYVDAITQE